MNKVFVVSGERESIIPPIAWTIGMACFTCAIIALNHQFIGGLRAIDSIMIAVAVLVPGIAIWRFVSRTPMRLVETDMAPEHVMPAVRAYERHLQKAEEMAKEFKAAKARPVTPNPAPQKAPTQEDLIREQRADMARRQQPSQIFPNPTAAPAPTTEELIKSLSQEQRSINA